MPELPVEEPLLVLGEDILDPEVPRVELPWLRVDDPVVEDPVVEPDRMVSEEDVEPDEPEVPDVEEPDEPDCAASPSGSAAAKAMIASFRIWEFMIRWVEVFTEGTAGDVDGVRRTRVHRRGT